MSTKLQARSYGRQAASGEPGGKDEGGTMNDEGERRKAEKRKSGKSRN
jgi:hypothetical protein